ncbi:LysR substrate-binding domain-containing protein [Microbulbifer hainanensis]|uniref:LysR substrate-binding domain-containing protein n=1 Tax=Microbulbifer hainanensis TaxID=2735675 RepID=UPI00186704D0|nr:LysR substrate-binding domain-containing protein [Microbulbifer hainanensis]
MSQPPLKALHYFCCAAGHASFKRAADELAVTPGAISQQIKTLEEWLGLHLFVRNARQVELTEAGSTFYRRINPLLSELLDVSQSMQRINRSRTVRITLPPSFAMISFGPRLAEFRRDHPDIELQVHASSMLSPLDGSDHDLAVRFLPEADPRLNCTCLANLEVFAACSPAYLQQYPGLLRGDLEGCTLIHDHLHQDWRRLIERAGLHGEPRDQLSFDQATLSHQAALGGLGIWLTDLVLSGPALRAGQLVALFDVAIPARRHLYLAHSRSASLSSAVVDVRHWLLEKFGGGEPPAVRY